MIKQLRKKFILVMMLSLFIVMGILVAAINIVYVSNNSNQTDATIEFLYANSGKFPDDASPAGGTDAASGTDVPPGGASGAIHFKKGEGLGGHITPDTKFETSFFMVTCGDDGTVVKVNHGAVASVTEDEISDYAQTILQGGSGTGTVDYFRYKVFTAGDGSKVIVAVNCYQQMRQERTLLLISSGAGILCMAAVYVLVLLMSRRVTKPVEESVEKQRQFITDAGHELKTPITIISANAEVLQMQTGENQWVDSIKNQTRRLNHLVKNLLELSKLDEALPADQFSDVDVSALVSEVAETFEVPAQAAGKSYAADIQPDIYMSGSRDELYKLVSILLDNALKYTNDGGDIKVSLTKQRRVTLSVCNTCDGIDPEKTSRLFERFYRADESRSRETGGSGIGLSIAQAIVERHGGKISASAEDGRTITFTAVF